MSAGGMPVVLTSTFPALKAFVAVAPSTMIGISIRVSLTDLALRHLVFFTRVTDASWRQAASLNGPLVTMLPGSVQFFPCRSTVARWTGTNEVWESCWTNHGCGETS